MNKRLAVLRGRIWNYRCELCIYGELMRIDWRNFTTPKQNWLFLSVSQFVVASSLNLYRDLRTFYLFPSKCKCKQQYTLGAILIQKPSGVLFYSKEQRNYEFSVAKILKRFLTRGEEIIFTVFSKRLCSSYICF